MKGKLHSVVALLRKSAVLRSTSYLASMVGVLATSSVVHRRYAAGTADHVHPIAFPGVVGITYLFARLRPADTVGWNRTPSRHDYAELAAGLTLGAAAISGILSIERALGWLSAPTWGWHNGIKPGTVIIVAVLTTAQEVPLIIDEELVFRGYGLDALRDAYGLPVAVVLSTLLYARYHGPGWRNLLGLSAFGLFLALLRLRTGSLWLPVGTHLAWNLMQTAVFGPAEGTPSLRPLRVHGPAQWVGTPSTVEWGWFGVLAATALAALAGAELWRHQAA